MPLNLVTISVFFSAGISSRSHVSIAYFTDMLPPGLSERQRFMFFAELFEHFSNTGELDPAEDVPFHAAMNSIHIGTTMLGRCDGTFTTVRREKRQVLATNDDRYCLARNTGDRAAQGRSTVDPLRVLLRDHLRDEPAERVPPHERSVGLGHDVAEVRVATGVHFDAVVVDRVADEPLEGRGAVGVVRRAAQASVGDVGPVEPLDVVQAILMLVRQINQGRAGPGNAGGVRANWTIRTALPCRGVFQIGRGIVRCRAGALRDFRCRPALSHPHALRAAVLLDLSRELVLLDALTLS